MKILEERDLIFDGRILLLDDNLFLLRVDFELPVAGIEEVDELSLIDGIDDVQLLELVFTEPVDVFELELVVFVLPRFGLHLADDRALGGHLL